MVEQPKVISDIVEFNYYICNNLICDWNNFFLWYEYVKNLKENLQSLRKDLYNDYYPKCIQPFEHNFSILYHFKQYYDLDSMLDQFLSLFSEKNKITAYDYSYCIHNYGYIYQNIINIEYHLIISFRDKCISFINLYHSLSSKINWTGFCIQLQSILYPRYYYSNKDIQVFKVSNERYLSYYDCIMSVMPIEVLNTFRECKRFVSEAYLNKAKLNNEFMQRMLNKSNLSFFNIDGKVLDLQQKKAVITNEDETLVIAGAGSGKTLTIAAKVKYLIEYLKVLPKEILLLSFTRASALEMEERVKIKLGLQVEVKTFHKLGLDIISSATGVRKSIIDENFLFNLTECYLIDNIFSSNELSKDITTYYRDKFKGLKKRELNNNLKEFLESTIDYNKKEILDEYDGNIYELVERLSEEKKTLQNEVLKSKEEVKIANFLFLTGIRYEYESDYIIDTANEEYRQYKPDFYLPDYDIYIEHFAIDKNGKASWLLEDAERYEKGVRWKRKIHDIYKTNLVETYSYEERDKVLLINLYNKLVAERVYFAPLDKEFLTKQLIKSRRKEYCKFTELIVKFINCCKSKGYTHSDLINLLNNELDEGKKCFYSIAEKVFLQYRRSLEAKGCIDFIDAIIDSTGLIDTDPKLVNYKYIIVDEYQDISNERYLLIDTIRKACNSKLFCVGDDWQAIYRFAGSDINTFLSTAKTSTILKIETTYRNPQSLINIAGKFVMQNPDLISKQLISSVPEPPEPTIQIYHYKGECCENAVQAAIEEIIRLYGDKEVVYLLGRYNSDIKNLGSILEIDDNSVKYSPYPNLQISFITVHKSKGLECDHVIILNGKKGKMGFPCEIEDEPVLKPFLSPPEKYLFGEERRLFYVALTRAKKTCRIMAPLSDYSFFVQELILLYQVPVTWTE